MSSVVSYAKLVLADAYQAVRGNAGEFSFLKAETARTLPGDLPREVCDVLRERIDTVIESGAGGRLWKDAVGSDSRILQFERDIPELVSAFDVPGRIRSIERYVGREIRSWTLMANRILPKTGNLGSGGGLHRDSPYSHQVKCIWYLSDVTEDNGPFQYAAGTHNDLMERRREQPLGESRFKAISEPMTSVTAPAGTLLICDTRCIHAGKPITAGARYAVTLYTFYDRGGVSRFFASAGLDPALAADDLAVPSTQPH